MPPMNVDLTDFETDIVLRPLTLADFDELIALSQACFPSIEPWSRGNVENQLATWSESQIGLFFDGRMVASCAHVVVHSAD